MPSDWYASDPIQFVDKRTMLRRDSGGLVHQRVNVWRGVVVRRGEKGLEFERCPHAHNSPGTARKCAERAARRFNREETRPDEGS